MKAIMNFFVFLFGTIYNYIYFELKKAEANARAKSENKQFHVIPTDDGLRVICNDNINAYNKLQKHKNSRKLTAKDVYEISVYSTSFRSKFQPVHK